MINICFVVVVVVAAVAVAVAEVRIATSVSEVFRDSAADHLLLFVCALIPKAMASLLTSTILELSRNDNVCMYVVKGNT